VLAYVIWRRRGPRADQAGYERALTGFHAALAADPPAGFEWFPSREASHATHSASCWRR
jgi:hypothetical protein